MEGGVSYRAGRSPYAEENTVEPGESDIPPRPGTTRLHAQHWPDPPGARWADIPDQPLCPLDIYGRATATFSAGVSSLLASGQYVWQEMAPGLELRLWLEGTPDAPRIRCGTRTAWDTAAPFAPLDSTRNIFPALGPRYAVPHAQIVRQQIALTWLSGWCETIANASPHLPIIVSGTMAEAGFSASRTKRVHDPFVPAAGTASVLSSPIRRYPGDDVNTQFLIEDGYQVSKLAPLGWDDLRTTGLPRIPTQPWSITTPGDVFVALANATATHNLLAPTPLIGIRLRPTDAANRARYVLTRAQLPIATVAR
jgi:hypothetical protein